MTITEALKSLADSFAALQLQLHNAETFQAETEATLAKRNGEIEQLKQSLAAATSANAALNEKLLATQKVLDDAMKAESSLHNIVTGGPG